MDDNERFYDDEIAPALKALCQRCRELGMSFLAIVEYKKGNRGRTFSLTKPSLDMRFISMAAAAGCNLDSLAIAMARICREEGIPHNSIVLERFGVPAGDPGVTR